VALGAEDMEAPRLDHPDVVLCPFVAVANDVLCLVFVLSDHLFGYGVGLFEFRGKHGQLEAFPLLNVMNRNMGFELIRIELAAAKDDVGPASGHVCRDSDRCGTAGFSDDACLLLVELRVEHVMDNAL